jgi:hypothetical protein
MDTNNGCKLIKTAKEITNPTIKVRMVINRENLRKHFPTSVLKKHKKMRHVTENIISVMNSPLDQFKVMRGSTLNNNPF